MFRVFNHRFGHYSLLLAVAALLSFPNLGAPSLWDIDEGNNAEAAREMMDSENWVIPTFNYQLRVDKPALLYWCQIGAYQLFGVNELAARFPSALAALLAVVLTYELGRRMFGRTTGLLAGLVLASGIGFCAAAHFANPDALLNCFTVLTLLIFWSGFANQSRSWFVLAGIVAGLAVLAKGPVGVVLPAGVIILFLILERKLYLLWDRRLLLGALAFAMIASPWYVWVAVDTKGAFLRGFLEKHNVGRFLNTMENHRGPIYYYLLVLLAGFAPWSVFLGPIIWTLIVKRAVDDGQDGKTSAGNRFLGCWIAVYLVFFSLAATKLPNYILPVYAPLAILTGRFLDCWCKEETCVPPWFVKGSFASLGLLGIGTIVGLLVAAGRIDVPKLHGRELGGLGAWAYLGGILVVGAATAWFCVRWKQRRQAVIAVCSVAILFLGAVAAVAGLAVDDRKAPKNLVAIAHACQTDREIRIGCFQYFQPSLVFYCRREVQSLNSEEEALQFLDCPLPAYLVLPAQTWQMLQPRVGGPHRLLARNYDLYRHYDVVVICNQ